VRATAPQLDVVTLNGEEPVSEADQERITLAFFSSDAWPESAPAFFRVALGAPNLRWLHTMSAGVDSPVFGMFVDRGARVTTSSGASAEPIAGTVMMYLLALSRGLPDLFRAQAAHEWRPRSYRELAGLSVAVVGYGPIGEHFARLATAFGMVPTIVRRQAIGDEPHPVRPLSELADVVAEVDVVVVALPLVPETTGLISADVIARMRPDALFVNVGRGELVDQPALAAALGEARLGGAGLDVFTPEPLPTDDALWDLPNVIVTPHSSGTSDGTAHRAALIFLDNLARITTGRELLNQVG
jgi:phosphoglycerate dehydrogenase-like enzyme